jgi:hypothetical protein
MAIPITNAAAPAAATPNASAAGTGSALWTALKPLLPYLGGAAVGLGAGALSNLGAGNPGDGGNNFLYGNPGQDKTFNRFNPQQQQGINTILQGALGRLGQNGQSPFAPIANQARENFQTQTIPSILERFTAQGAGGGRSGALGQQLGAAGAGLESSLASQESKMLMNLLQLGLTPQFENAYIPRDPGFLESGLEGLLKALPLLLPLFV